MSSVYLMKNLATGYYKIGRGEEPSFREKTLQGQEPDVRLLAARAAPRQTETALHKRLCESRVRGEWFSLDYSQLYGLAEFFEVGHDTLDIPSQCLQGDSWSAAMHRYSPYRTHMRVRRRRDNSHLFETPYTMSRCEIEEQYTAHLNSCEIPEELQSLIGNALINVVIDRYCLEEMSVELRELSSFGSGKTEGYHVITNHWSLSRFFSSVDHARLFFDRMRKTYDALHAWTGESAK